MGKTIKIFLALAAGIILLETQIKPNFAFADFPTATISGAGSGSSYNWAGYTAAGGSFTGVTGSWVVPAPTASGNFSADAEWIGIGGINSSDLIQVGTQTIFSGSQPAYQAWYETLPGASKNIAMTIKPGDQMSASIISNSSGQWTVSLADLSTGQNFQTVVPYASSESSAEWVVEMPTQVGSGFIPLDNFGAVSFSSATAIKNGVTQTLSQLAAQPLTMASTAQQVLASTGSINGDGASFSVTRTSVTASTSPGIGSFSRNGFRRQGRGAQGFNFQIRDRDGYNRQHAFFILSGFGRPRESGLRFYARQ
ncbi:MAG: G1 family endopeptidase [Candidatus Doudnabacteria bacterium]|nr:G1 family endopeptidase [Candidatus Doudnabacteria bacterium]